MDFKYSASSEDIHGVTEVKAKKFTPDNANAVSFQIKTQTGWKDITLFFDENVDAASDFYSRIYRS